MHHNTQRRRFLKRGFAVGSAAIGSSLLPVPGIWTPGAFAEALTQTASQTEGPFYPDQLPLDTDNDLLRINDLLTPAVGEVTHLSGRVMNIRGEPMRNVVVEIWQVDSNGTYLHSESSRRGDYDQNFQGYGRFLTNRKGEYYFRTIKPVMYGSRTPHIHFAVNRGDRRLLTTQCYIKGEPKNERDFVLGRIRDQKLRDSVIVDFRPIADSKLGELSAQFDLILGITPEG
ncbi:MAG: protocatechuate 3,4-dioxygenase [Planctomycetota bacterium]